MRTNKSGTSGNQYLFAHICCTEWLQNKQMRGYDSDTND